MKQSHPEDGPHASMTRPGPRPPEWREEHLRAIATGVLIGQRGLSLTQATVLFAATARASRRSVDDVAREIIRDYGTRLPDVDDLGTSRSGS